MTISFKFYHDAALTQEITSGNPLTATQETSGALGAVDKTIYLGSTVTGNKAQATSNPGVDPVVVSIADADAGTGAPATEFKLSLSPITGAETAGAALTLSATLLSGVANAIPIYTRRVSALAVAGSYTDLTLQTNSLNEIPV
ncbi:MAG: hypothetical protein M0Q15_15800 [Nevskia sp.]|jgi:hypothetical protein|nr:hypothetical protein [Nevskia sp.]